MPELGLQELLVKAATISWRVKINATIAFLGISTGTLHGEGRSLRVEAHLPPTPKEVPPVLASNVGGCSTTDVCSEA